MINIEFWAEEYNKVGGISMDLIDFTILCHAGKNKDSEFFEKIIDMVNEVHDEENYEVN